jgi:hypothetical protein
MFLPVLAFAESATTTSAGATVTYSPSTELSCPANSTLNGAQCYCYKGYIASGNSCTPYVPPPPPPTPANTIYNDILMSLTVNDDKTCAQLFILKADIDMCSAYRGDANKDSWKSIDRPAISSTNAPAISNPWAPASKQTFSGVDVNGTGTTTPQIVPATVVPPPAPATTTADTSDDTSAAAQALAKLAATPPPAPAPTPAPDPVPPPPPPTPAPDPQQDPATVLPPDQVQPAVIDPNQTANAAAAQAANMMQLPAGLTPISNSAPQSDTSGGIGLTDDQKISGDAPPSQPGFFAKIFGWLFGWL